MRSPIQELSEKSSLQKTEEDFRRQVSDFPAITYRSVFRDKWIFQFISPIVENITGFPPDQFQGREIQSWESLIHPVDIEKVRQSIYENSSRDYTVQYRINNSQGRTRWICEKGRHRRQKEDAIDLRDGILLDITDTTEGPQNLYFLATHDNLTGLPNRTLFMDRLNQAMAKAKRNQEILGVFFIDLDDFKNINDTYGHAQGDQVLRMVAQRLRGCLRETDTVARLGGDEFTVLIENASNFNLQFVAKKLLLALGFPLELDAGKSIPISPSIGISIFTEGDTAEILLQKADVAMYHAKRKGKKNFQVYADRSLTSD